MVHKTEYCLQCKGYVPVKEDGEGKRHCELFAGNRIFDICIHSAKHYPDLPAFSYKKADERVSYTYADYLERSKKLAKGFIAFGLKKGDKVATLCNNRPEWNFLDMAISMIGAVHVPLYPNFSKHDFKYILEYTEVSYLFVVNNIMLRLLKTMAEEIPGIKAVFACEFTDDTASLNDVLKAGEDISDDLFIERMSEVGTDDPAAIYHTSGSGGKPKGALVSHANIMGFVNCLSAYFELHPGERTLSYLPLSHSFESSHNYFYQLSGATVFYAESVSSVLYNLREVKPVMFLGVPLLLEKIVNTIREGQTSRTKLSQKLNEWTYKLTQAYSDKKSSDIFYHIKKGFADIFVFPAWKKVLGGNIRTILAGGASLPEAYFKVFHAMGVHIAEVYGMTETYGITLNSQPHGRRMGTVGSPVKDVEVKLSEDGEILVRSPYVIQGYYKAPDHAKEVFDENGWFKTGDMGMWEDGRFLKITGRKKDVFKMASGNFVSPELIERQLKGSPFVKHALVTGKDQFYLSALIIPDEEYLTQMKKERGLWTDDDTEIIVKQLVDNYNKAAFGTERIEKFLIKNDVWSIEGGELTHTMKMKRAFLHTRYKEEIKAFYEQE